MKFIFTAAINMILNDFEPRQFEIYSIDRKVQLYLIL